MINQAKTRLKAHAAESMQPHERVSGGAFSHDVNHLYHVPVALPVCCDTSERKKRGSKGLNRVVGSWYNHPWTARSSADTFLNADLLNAFQRCGETWAELSHAHRLQPNVQNTPGWIKPSCSDVNVTAGGDGEWLHVFVSADFWVILQVQWLFSYYGGPNMAYF